VEYGLPRFLENGEFTGYIGSCVDVHERKENEEKVRLSEERLSLATKAAKLGILDWDLINDDFRINRQVHEQHGIPDDEENKRDAWFKTIHHDDVDHVRKTLREALIRPAFEMDFKIIHAVTGVVQYMRFVGNAHFDSQKKAVRILGVISNVTEEKFAHDKLQESEERYRKLFKATPVPT
jgi:PAS domain S-box-containing protein